MSCLFNSLSYFIKENSCEIRRRICDYLQENRPIIDGLDTHEVLGFEIVNPLLYIQRMRNTSSWGGAIEIQVACNLWNARIVVKNHRDNTKDIEFIPVISDFDKTFTLYWNGNHYEPIQTK